MSKRFIQIAIALLLLVVGVALFAWQARAQEDGDPVVVGTWHVIESEALAETRRLAIHLPRGYEGSGITYPVVYHTYGDYLMSYFVPAAATVEALGELAATPQMILVGIDNIDRYRDLLPLQRDGSPSGIDAYTRFLAEEVIPFVEANYRTADYRILVGPQAGAVFGLHTRLERPDLFDACILDNPFAFGPSSELLMNRARETFADGGSAHGFLFLTLGPDPPEALAAAEDFAALAAGSDVDVHLNRLEEDLNYMHPGALDAGLRRLFPDYAREWGEGFVSLAAIDAFYGALSDRYGFEMAPPEVVMTFSASDLKRQGELDAALEILERQVALYPNMVNGFWQLAELCTMQGRRDEAIGHYRRCIEIDPSVANFANRRIAGLATE